MATRLAGKGYRVVAVTNWESELGQKLTEWGIKRYKIRISNISFFNLLKIYKIYRILKRENIATIILNLSIDLKLAGVAAKLAGTKKILYARGMAKPVRNSILNRFLFRSILTGVIANSISTKEMILKNNPNLIKKDRILVNYLGIDLAAFDAENAHKILKREVDEIILGTAGRLVRQKNQKFLIDVAKLLKQRNIRFRMLIAGVGDLQEKLKNYVTDLGLEEEVIFLGFVDRIKDFMKSIDVFLLSSLWEGFGYVLVEAMASSKPVIALNSSSEPEIVKNRETGFIIDQGDSEGFVNKVELFASNRKLIEEFGERGRKSVEERFDIPVTMQNFVKMI